MSEDQTLCYRRFRFGPVIETVAIAVLLNLAAYVSADDTTVALPSSVTSTFTQLLPDTWAYEIKGARLVLRPRKEPEFVNLVNAGRQRPSETLDDYRRRHTVTFDYQ